MKKLLIFDANSILNRAFYGIRPLTTRDGLHTNAVYGYINIVKKHIDNIKPDFIAAAFDVHAPTFRHKMCDFYKGTRKPMPDELREQLPYIREATEALGIKLIEKEGYEADDILGTLSLNAEKQGEKAYLVTGDRDFFQLVSDGTTVILAGNNSDDSITPEVIHERFGLTPHQLIDVKALAGDTSDNIPGVRGIGEKTAVKLISEKYDLDGVYSDISSLSIGASAKEKLSAGKDDAYLSRKLAEICREVPDMPQFSELSYSGIVPERLRPLLEKLEFGKMLRSFGLDEPAIFEPQIAEKEESDQISIFDTAESSSTEVLESIDAGKITSDIFPLFFDDNGFYIYDNAKAYKLEGDIFSLLKKSHPILSDYKGYLHKIYDIYGDIRGVEAHFDLALAAYVINSSDSSPDYSRLALIYLKKNFPSFALSDPISVLHLTDELYPVISAALAESGAEKLFYEVELPLSYVLAKMEIDGFYVSKEGLENYGKFLQEKASLLEKEIYEIAGENFNINSPKQLSYILFDKLMLPTSKGIGKKNKRGYYSTAEDILKKLAPYSPIIDKILEYRSYTKLYGTYVVGLISQIASDGRIHTVFNQTLTATGRLSSAEPNLQNIPVKTEMGREFRKFFAAEKDGYLLIDADYSQIELRILAHISGDEMLCEMFRRGYDIHASTAAKIFHIPESDVTPEMRKSAKAVNFGIVYGIGNYSLGQDIGIPMWQAKEYINDYFALFPKVKEYLDSAKDNAHKSGYVSTIFGRRRFIPEITSAKKMLVSFGERVAMNAPIQGTAADIIKIAMVNVVRRLEKENLSSRLILQVHDELIIEAPQSEAEYIAKLLSEEMQNAVKLDIPLVAEAMIGKTWYDAK